MTTTYAVLLPGDEDTWARASEQDRRRTYDRHEEFATLLAERGHDVVGGAELAHSRTARTLRTASDGTSTVTEGPYAETTEQLTGFYLVRTDDPDGLLEVCRVLGEAEGVIEVRACVDHGSAS